jgi:hypothetical protein
MRKVLVSTLIALHARDATTAHQSPDGRQKVNHAQVAFHRVLPIDNQKHSSNGIDAIPQQPVPFAGRS